MPSRRDVLRLAAVAAASGLAGCTGSDFDAPETPTGEWHTARRDVRNTACAPEATPPESKPGRRWSRAFQTGPPVELLASADSLYAVRANGTTVVSRDDGAWKWGTYGRDQTPAAGLPRAAALAPDSLYTADGRYARAFDRDGTFRWQTAYPENSGGEARIYGVLPTGDGVLLGGHGRLSVFDSNGDYQWTFADTGGSGATYPALAADELYVAGPGPLLSLSPRSSPESLLGRPPSTEWVSDAPGGPTWPVVTDEYVVLGDTDRAGGGRTRGNLHVYRRDGTHVRSISSDGGHSHLAVASDQSAVLYGTGVFGDVEGTVTALDLSSGETRWTREDLSVAEWGTSLVVAGDTCLFAEATDGHSARVHALDVATGETRWVLATERTPEALIVAGSQVYLATAGGLVAYE